jgi:Homeodomain-like domain
VDGIWAGLTGRERRVRQSCWVQITRQDRDRAILAADAAGHTAEVIGRSFGLSRMTVARIVRTRNQGKDHDQSPA